MDKNFCAHCGTQLGAVKYFNEHRAFCDEMCSRLYEPRGGERETTPFFPAFGHQVEANIVSAPNPP